MFRKSNSFFSPADYIDRAVDKIVDACMSPGGLVGLAVFSLAFSALVYKVCITLGAEEEITNEHEPEGQKLKA